MRAHHCAVSGNRRAPEQDPAGRQQFDQGQRSVLDSADARYQWTFERIWDVATLYNSRYGLGLSEEMGQLQLTRYAPGQLYDWHMDLGGGAMSLRKISIVVELAAGGYDGGGTEVFYGERRNNRIALGRGDALVFPSFIMHRALPVHSRTRWTLVSWLTGLGPLT
jgi:PKHD-type hydroxylase